MGLRTAGIGVALILVLGLGAVAQQRRAAAQHGAGERADIAKVTVHDVEGDRIGTVTLESKGEAVRIDASLRKLEPGFHGFHIHETGICDPDAPDGPFTSAGGHYAGDGGDHGDHAGDLSSLFVMADGTARLSLVTDAFTIDELRAGDGSAVMVHADRDNFANIPGRYVSELSGEPGPDAETLATGDAGSRAGCGVIGAEPVVREGAGLVTVTSDVSVRATVRRIRRDINRSGGLEIVAVVNHARAARRADLRLRPTTLIIFGNPEAGTRLMQQAQTLGIDLPQKLLVWKDDTGRTRVTFNDPGYLADRHGITGLEDLLGDIRRVLRRLATGG